ncbi:MAG: hypothetical protein JWM93_2194 [Frankiales bacterium]|nr:hypothetical protein [Frankiales bacterium]
MHKGFVLLLAAFMIMATAEVAEATSYSVSISASRTTIELGQTFQLTGKVSPNAKKKKVKIQRQYLGGSWKTIKTIKLSSKSTYTYTVKPTTGGPTLYRVQKPKSGKRSAKTSQPRLVDVYRWRALQEFPREAVYTVTYGPRSIGGTTFPASAALDGQESTWTFGGSRCTVFRSSIGVDDTSTPGVTSSPNFMWNHNIGGQQMFQLSPRNDGLATGQNPRSFVEPIPADKTTLYVNSVFGGAAGTRILTLGTPQLYCNS